MFRIVLFPVVPNAETRSMCIEWFQMHLILNVFCLDFVGNNQSPVLWAWKSTGKRTTQETEYM